MHFFLIAGEPSGDRLGGALMAGLRRLHPEVRFSGIGGPGMQAQGLVSLFPMEELSLMGLAEVLPKYLQLKRRIAQAAQEALRLSPDALITIDSPDFNLRVARRVREGDPGRSIRTVHYVAPSVWAWRPGRAAKMARWIDHVLALLPFEPPLMEAAGMRCDFVGHPVVSEPVPTPGEVSAFRASEGLGEAPVIVALPGSRRGEVERLAPVFGESLRLVLARHPRARVVVPAATPVAERVAALVAGWPGSPLVLDPRTMPIQAAEARKRAAFAAAGVALAASGTVSLELAAVSTPMVIAYDMNWLSRALISRMLRVDTVTLVNLVSETRSVPEFLGAACTPGNIAAGVLEVMEDPRAQRAAMDLTMQHLGRGGEAPGLRAARAVLAGLDEAGAMG